MCGGGGTLSDTDSPWEDTMKVLYQLFCPKKYRVHFSHVKQFSCDTSWVSDNLIQFYLNSDPTI